MCNPARVKTAAEHAAMYEQAIENCVALGANASYTVMGKSFSKVPLSELQRLYNYWRGVAAQESGPGFTVPNFRRNDY